MPLHESTAADPILRLPAVARMFDVHPGTIENMVRRGQFPMPLQLSAGLRPRKGWRRSVLVAHLERLQREADQRTRAAAATSQP